MYVFECSHCVIIRFRFLLVHKNATTKEVKLKQQQEKEARDYKHLMKTENMTSVSEVRATEDATAAEEYEDDFF